MKSCLTKLFLLAFLAALLVSVAYFTLGGGRTKETFTGVVKRLSEIKFTGSSTFRPDVERAWVANDGRRLTGILVSASSDSCLLRVTTNQRVYRVPLTRLSSADQNYVRNWSRKNKKATMPSVTLDNWVPSYKGVSQTPIRRSGEGKGDVWESTNFIIEAYPDIEEKFLQNFSATAESIRGAIHQVPLPLTWGREERGKSKIILYRDRSAYNKTFLGGATAFDGHYDLSSRVVHIPVDSFNVEMVHSGQNRPAPSHRKNFDVLVHEMVHQATPGITDPLFPAWVYEGIAEYFSATQTVPGSFSFRNTTQAIRRFSLEAQGGAVQLTKVELFTLEEFSDRRLMKWNRTTHNDSAGVIQYLEALVLVEYFCHGDGNSLRAYIEAVFTGLPEREAAAIHLLRGRSWPDIEKAVAARWAQNRVTFAFSDNPSISNVGQKAGVGYEFQ